ncbi:hypothetical protein HPB48_006177 [Haemaphysalis longicornis]|uniref:Uncharacterized protein n=1 Tax=Haemaphysalis longicornis TaxID=44386 RepID=A0A9J6GTM7_HAELO|nr:hypothetical protein HPB48_006177 [Haemaphysalis longicornis]
MPEQGYRASYALRCGKKRAALANVNKRVNAASRLPPLSKEHILVTVCPRGVLDFKALGHLRVAQNLNTTANLLETNLMEDIQCRNMMRNIMIASPLSKRFAMAYAGVKDTNIGKASYELNASFASSENSCKLVSARSTTDTPISATPAVESTIKPIHTGTLRCSLPGCGENNPDIKHDCSPKYTFCGGPHMTVDEACKQCYQGPFLVCQRRRERPKRGDSGSNT